MCSARNRTASGMELFTYLDPQNIQQGPFAFNQLISWCAAGQMPASTRVRLAKPFEAYRVLSEVVGFPDHLRLASPFGLARCFQSEKRVLGAATPAVAPTAAPAAVLVVTPAEMQSRCQGDDWRNARPAAPPAATAPAAGPSAACLNPLVASNLAVGASFASSLAAFLAPATAPAVAPANASAAAAAPAATPVAPSMGLPVTSAIASQAQDNRPKKPHVSSAILSLGRTLGLRGTLLEPGPVRLLEPAYYLSPRTSPAAPSMDLKLKGLPPSPTSHVAPP